MKFNLKNMHFSTKLLLMSLTIVLSIRLFGPSSPLDMNNPSSLWVISSFISDLFLLIILSILTFVGVKAVRENKLRGKIFFLSGCLCFWLVFTLLLMTFSGAYAGKLARLMDLPQLEKKSNDPDLPLKERIVYSRILAEDTYELTGKRINYIDKNGVERLYQPTGKIIKLKKNRYSIYWLIRAINIWPVVFLINLVLGLFIPIKNKNL